MNESSTLGGARATSKQVRYFPQWVLTLAFVASAPMILVGIFGNTGFNWSLVIQGFGLLCFAFIEQADRNFRLKQEATVKESISKE